MPLYGYKWLLLGDWLAQGHTMYSEAYDYTGPLSSFIYKWFDLVFGNTRWTHIVGSTFLIIFQAGILNNIFLKNKAFDENTYVVAFIYVILMCGVMDYYMLSPQLMSMTFVIISLNNIFRRIDNEVTDELFLTSGIYLGLATFFYFPAVVYLVTYLLSFVIFSTAILRRLLLLAYGTGLVFLVIWGYFFWFDSSFDFLQSFFVNGLLREKVFHLTYQEFFLQSSVILLSLALSLTVFFTARFSNFQQKIQRVMFLFLLAAIVSMLISPELNGADILFSIPSTAFFLSHYLLLLRKRWKRAIIPSFLIFLIVLFPFYWNQKITSSFFLDSYEGSSVQDRRIMLIGDQMSIYKGNKIASPFIDEYSSRIRMEGLRYYEDAASIYDAVISANPDLIIDEWDVYPQMKRIFPLWASQFKEVSPGKYEKISN